ncbi:MAG: methionyl-tRNA formyltransferase [Myxococcota bacterium]
MRVAFMGTPELAAASLGALLESRHTVVCVVSQPDRRAGRGNRLRSPPVAELARAHGLPLQQPERVGTEAFREWIAGFSPDVAAVAAYGHVLGPKLLAVPRLGCVNVHASLLPRWRGASPIQAAILAGDSHSGVCIMEMERGLDTGPVLARESVAIGPNDTAETLHDALAAIGARLLVATLDRMEAGPVAAEPQDEAAMTYAPLVHKADADLDWRRPAVELERRVRALHPWPGTRTQWGETTLKVLPPALVLDLHSGQPPGTVLAASADGVDVACGEGALRLLRLQAPGRSAMDVGSFLAGHTLAPGARLALSGEPA